MSEPRKGFTLIELMVTLTLLGIIVVLTFSYTDFLHGLIVKSELQTLERTCQYLQRMAKVHNQSVSIHFNDSTHSYEYMGNRHYCAKQVAFGILPGVKGPPSLATHAIRKPITFQDNTITFSPEGIIGSGTVYMIDKKKSVLYALSSGVSQVSYLRMYRYDSGWKLIEE